MKHALKTGAILLIALTMLFCVACPKDSENPTPTEYKMDIEGEITFTNYTNNDEMKASINAYVKAFEKKHPNAKVNIDYCTGSLLTRSASGDVGDVFNISAHSTDALVNINDILMNLDSYLDILSIDTTDINASALNLGKVDGSLYMASISNNHYVLMANTKAIKAEGLNVPSGLWTWDQFIYDYAPKLTKLYDNGSYAQVPMYITLDYDPIYIPFMEGFGGKWYDSVNKKINLTTDDKVLQGISTMIRAAEDGFLYPTAASSSNITSKYENLKNTNYVFRQLIYPSLLSAGTEYDNEGIEWDIVSFPQFPNPKVGTDSSGFGVYNRTNHPDTAAALALFILTNEGQKAFNGQTGGSVPLLKSLAEDDFWRGKVTSWNSKNYDAFVSFPDADTVGHIECCIPSQVAYLIDGVPWTNMLRNHFDGKKDFIDSLKQIEELANERWKKLSNEFYYD